MNPDKLLELFNMIKDGSKPIEPHDVWVQPDPDWELDSDNTYIDEDFEDTWLK